MGRRGHCEVADMDGPGRSVDEILTSTAASGIHELRLSTVTRHRHVNSKVDRRHLWPCPSLWFARIILKTTKF